MKNNTKLALLLLASVTLHIGAANAPANAQQAAEEQIPDNAPDAAVTTSFTPQELSFTKGENFFDLGKLTQPVSLKKIKAPSRHEAFVGFKFTTESGLETEYLIRRVTLTADRVKKLRGRSQRRNAFKNKVAGEVAQAGSGIITAFYFRHPATQQEWTEMYTVTDAGKYRFAPTFDARIYPNGLVVLDVRGKDNLLFGTGEKTAQQLLISSDLIEIGGGKTASAAKIAQMDI